MKTSSKVAERLRKAGIPFKANDNIAPYVTAEEREQIQKEVERGIENVLRSLVIDVDNDPNTCGTAERIARMYLNEVFAGRFNEMPKATDFPNTKKLEDILVVKTTIRSTCSHHFAPILGVAWIGVIPDERVIGISKFHRLADWVCSRPQIQEECAVQLADLIEKLLRPKGIAIVMKASHTCMTWRGVKDSDAVMTTSVMRGIFRDNPQTRNEFMSLLKEPK